MKINLYNQTSEDIKEIKKLLKKVFRSIKQKNNMQIIFVSQEEIRELNKNFRNIDKSTDVLSFPNDDELDSSIGDVFISIEQARLQANDYGHSFEREIGFLAVHGYLHLLGFDHHSESEEKLMIEAQENILKKAKLERK
ncbi:MAG: rRNA maturation RNase YbeY [Tenericutes bacterium HGW-Tenericutes-2]|nr:MAG: rRNA maturation RNase YbeY [Tenericutes bacterium HGW-Tenericutes-2]